MKTEKKFYKICIDNRKFQQEIVFKRSISVGIFLCLAGISVGIYAFYVGLLSILGIVMFFGANALFLAGVFQLLGVAEITCPVCGKMTGVSRLQKECKCRICRNKIKITKKED